MSWTLLQNSLIVATLAAVIATLLGGPAALFASALPRWPRRTVLACAVAALALPPFLVTNTWLHYFGLAGVLRGTVDFNLYSLPGTVLLLAFMLWPISFLFVFSRMATLERTCIEQDPWLRGIALFRFVIWPHCRGSVAQAFALAFVLAFNNFSVPALLQMKVYAAEVWLAFNTRVNYAEVLALSWPLIVLPLLLILWLGKKGTRFEFQSELQCPELLRERIGSAAGLLLGSLTVLACLVSLVLPLSQLVSSSRTWAEFLPAIAAGRTATVNSLLIAVGASLLVLALGLLTMRFRVGVFSWSLFLIPGVLLGVALIWLLNRPGLAMIYGSLTVVFIGFGVRYFALGWGGARLAHSTTDPRPGEVVRVCGGTAWDRFRWAEWPQMKPTVLASWYLIYLFCLWEVETLILIVPPGRETLSLRIFNMLHYGHASQVDALCVWLLVLALAPLLIWAGWQTVRKPALALCGAAYLAGCTGQPPEGHSQVESAFFSSVQVIGSRGTGAGQFNKPRSVAVDGEDNLYVVDLTGRVQKFSPEGKFVLLWQMPETDKGKAKGMMEDADGNVIVIEPHYSRVNHYSQTGEVLHQWGEEGAGPGQLLFPRSAAINSHGDIYLSEYGQLERIHQFTHRGEKWVRTFGTRGLEPGELNRAEGLGIDSEDLLYVADSCNHRIQILSPEGKFLAAFGTAGSGLGELSYPYDIRIDPLGNRFVCEFGNSRVQIFNARNEPVEILGGAGSEVGKMNNPWAIALDSRGNLYVADSLNHRVQKFVRTVPIESPKSTTSNGALPKLALRR